MIVVDLYHPEYIEHRHVELPAVPRRKELIFVDGQPYRVVAVVWRIAQPPTIELQ